jgi:hypothetical protein
VVRRLILSKFSGAIGRSKIKLKDYLGVSDVLSKATKISRTGLGLSGALLIVAGLWLLAVVPDVVAGLVLATGLIVFGLFNLISALTKGLTISRANQLSLAGHFVAILSFYVVLSRFLQVSYTTDTIVGTYMGVLRVLQFQSPYGFSIKPLLDQFGFSPSFYTPGVDGSFDFHLAYPSLSFLSVLPFYLVGLHDLRDSVLIFHIMSILLLFGLAPARLKSITLAPFSLFSIVIAGSWTDSVWAFFLILTAVLWYRHPKASWISLGLTVAVKQIAVVIVPFLLIRLWYQKPESRLQTLSSSIGLMLAAFLLPNIPFIIASPGSWWADIVAPYLPNATPQVPGGIGLSGFLLDLGVALPSSFFLVLMLGTSSLLLFLYARHFRGLNSVVFAFPILLFFLYYRSFPNYMAYWLFPLVFELGRLGGPRLRLPLTMKLPGIAWRPSGGTLLRVFRQKLTPSIVLVLVVTLAFVGVSGAYISQVSSPKALIQINGVMDPDSIGAATVMNVTFKNLLTTPVSPTFFVKYGPLPYFWSTNSSGVVTAGSQSNYMISASDALSAVPRGDQFHVMIYDKLTGQLLGESQSWKVDVSAPPLANPWLKWWILEQSLGKKAPFSWTASLSNTDPVASSFTPLGRNGTSGVRMTLNYTSNPNGLVEGLVLSQRVPLNATGVNIHLNQSLTTNIATKTMFGASVTDGTHNLYFIFSDKATQQTISSYPTNTTVIVPTSTSMWNTIRIDPQTLWNSQGWTTPQQVTLAVFLQSAAEGVYYASINAINPA